MSANPNRVEFATDCPDPETCPIDGDHVGNQCPPLSNCDRPGHSESPHSEYACPDRADSTQGIPLDAAAARQATGLAASFQSIPLDVVADPTDTDQFVDLPTGSKYTLRQRAKIVAEHVAGTMITVASMLPLLLGLYVANWSALLAKETLNMVQAPNGSLVNTALAFGLVVAASATGMVRTMNWPFLYEDSLFLQYHRRIAVGLGILTGSGTLLALNAALLLVALH